jgi:hypothetical protein
MCGEHLWELYLQILLTGANLQDTFSDPRRHLRVAGC